MRITFLCISSRWVFRILSIQEDTQNDEIPSQCPEHSVLYNDAENETWDPVERTDLWVTPEGAISADTTCEGQGRLPKLLYNLSFKPKGVNSVHLRPWLPLLGGWDPVLSRADMTDRSCDSQCCTWDFISSIDLNWKEPNGYSLSLSYFPTLREGPNLLDHWTLRWFG